MNEHEHIQELQRQLAHERAERQHAETVLQESERMLAGLMHNLPGMAYRCRIDPGWTMEFISEGSLALTGYAPADLIDNRRITYGRLIHPDDRARVQQTVQAALEAQQPFEVTYRLTTASGAEKWVWEQGRRVEQPSGSVEALEGFITDMRQRVLAHMQALHAVPPDVHVYAYSTFQDCPINALASSDIAISRTAATARA